MVTKRQQPLYDKLAWQIKTQIADGAYQPGQKLPSVREMALMVELNPNTVAKAYQSLEVDGVVMTITGRGTFVADSAQPASEATKARLRAQLRDVAVDARSHHVSAEQLIIWLTDSYQGNE